MGLPKKVLVMAPDPNSAGLLADSLGYAITVWEFDRECLGLPAGQFLYEVAVLPQNPLQGVIADETWGDNGGVMPLGDYYDGRDGSLEIPDVEQEAYIEQQDRLMRQERQRLEDYDAGIIHDDDH